MISGFHLYHEVRAISGVRLMMVNWVVGGEDASNEFYHVESD